MEKLLTDYLDKGLAFAQEFIAKHGVEAWDMVLWLYRLRIIENLVMVAIFAGGILYLTVRFRTWLHSDPEDADYYVKKRDWSMPEYGAPMGISWFISLICIAVIASHFLNPWTYVGLVKPELAIARDVFNRVVK